MGPGKPVRTARQCSGFSSLSSNPGDEDAVTRCCPLARGRRAPPDESHADTGVVATSSVVAITAHCSRFGGIVLDKRGGRSIGVMSRCPTVGRQLGFAARMCSFDAWRRVEARGSSSERSPSSVSCEARGDVTVVGGPVGVLPSGGRLDAAGTSSGVRFGPSGALEVMGASRLR